MFARKISVPSSFTADIYVRCLSTSDLVFFMMGNLGFCNIEWHELIDVCRTLSLMIMQDRDSAVVWLWCNFNFICQLKMVEFAHSYRK